MANNAPGKHYRKGMSLVQITRKFPNDKAAEQWFIKKRWGDKPYCPHCGSENVQSGAKHKTMPYRCREKECGKRFSVKTKTVMESSNLGYQVWAIAIYLLTTGIKGVSSMKLHRDLEITQKSAWFLAHRMRESYDDLSGFFSGPVEVDETYMGGKRKNMSNKKRKALKDTGRGGVGKAVVAGMRDRATRKVSAAKVSNTDQKTLHDFINSRVDEDSMVFTDDHRSYQGLPNHKTVKHSVSEYVNGMAHTNGIESFWALLKRGYHGTFHHMSEKHLDRYVGEFAGRYNQREMDTPDQMAAIAKGFENKRLKYKDLVA